MNSTLNTLRNAARFLACIGLLALTTTEEVTGLWLYGAWVLFILSFILDRHPQKQRVLRKRETFAVIGLVALSMADLFVLKNTFYLVIAHFLLVFQMFKLVGLKERKDCLQIGLIGFFQLLAACTLSADVWQAILLFLFIPGATALLFWNYAARVAEESAAATAWPMAPLKKLHASISLAALPLNILMTVAVFVLFPRLTFNLRVPGFGAGRSAYTDQMNLAQNGSITQDSTVALWMGFADETQRNLWSGYLRGDVMDTFDGQNWSNSHQAKTHLFQPNRNGAYEIQAMTPGVQPLRTRITLLNTTKNTLFTPGSPLQIIAPLGHLEASDAADFHWNLTLQHPLQYQVLAMPDERRDPAPDPSTIQRIYEQLPDHGLERTRVLALRVAGDGPLIGKARALEAYLRTNYRYSLDLGTTVPDNPVDAFLFERRAGFCIHFASALAVMLRLNGIPSRVVAGYYQGEWNPLAQQVLFREKDAHAWVEAWIDDQWVMLDPSPRADFDGAARRATRVWRLRLQETWDYLGYQWNRVVIEYDLYAQLRVWERLRSHSDTTGGRWARAWLRLRGRFFHGAAPAAQGGESAESDARQPANSHAPALLALLAAGALLSLFIGGWLRRAAKSEIPEFYVRFLRRMGRAGVDKKDAETAEEFAQRAARKLPKQAARIHETTTAYYRARFGKK